MIWMTSGQRKKTSRAKVDVFDFSLSAEEVAALDALTTEEVRAEAQSLGPSFGDAVPHKGVQSCAMLCYVVLCCAMLCVVFQVVCSLVLRPLGAAPQRHGRALGPRPAAREADAGGLHGTLWPSVAVCSAKALRA